jgi:hypothetical protein
MLPQTHLYAFILASHKRIKLNNGGTNSRSIIYCSNPHLTTKVRFKSIISHQPTHGSLLVKFKLGRAVLVGPTDCNRANNDELSLLIYVAVRPMVLLTPRDRVLASAKIGSQSPKSLYPLFMVSEPYIYYHQPTYAFIIASCKRVNPKIVV